MSMPVIRIEKTKNYTVMSNEHLRDPALSLAARGLMSMMLSLPDDWDYSIAGLVTQCNEGQKVVRRCLSEMEKAGYLTRERINADGGRFTYEYTLTECPQPCDRSPHAPQGHAVEGHALDGAQLNTDLPNTDIQNTDLPSTEKKPRKARKEPAAEKKEEKGKEYPLPLEMLTPKVREVFAEYVAMRKKIKKPLTTYAERLAVKKLIDLAGKDEQKQIAVLEQSIANSWQGLFPLKDAKRQTFADRTAPPIANVRREDYSGDQVPW